MEARERSLFPLQCLFGGRDGGIALLHGCLEPAAKLVSLLLELLEPRRPRSALLLQGLTNGGELLCHLSTLLVSDLHLLLPSERAHEVRGRE